ncbi:MAG: DUF1206 domain-containing protein [Cyanobacteriota bacterium]|nr:DUF1206 domain-containing protein [Cyanobacteriota bacterium]
MNKYYALWVPRFARFGYGARCFVYVLVGAIAAKAAFTYSTPKDSETALAVIAEKPFGKMILALVVVGLFGDVLWRFVQAIQDPEHRGNKVKNILRRITHGIGGIVGTGLMLSALRSIADLENDVTQSLVQTLAVTVLLQPFGRWLVGIGGAIAVGVGCYYFYRALSAKFRKHLQLCKMSPTTEKWVMLVARFGITTRGVVFVLVGGFLMKAARSFDASKVKTSEEALQSLDDRAFGPWLLAIVALGLIAYGAYMGVLAKYRRIEVG